MFHPNELPEAAIRWGPRLLGAPALTKPWLSSICGGSCWSGTSPGGPWMGTRTFAEDRDVEVASHIVRHLSDRTF